MEEFSNFEQDLDKEPNTETEYRTVSLSLRLPVGLADYLEEKENPGRYIEQLVDAGVALRAAFRQLPVGDDEVTAAERTTLRDEPEA
ncbi:hypothetical protein GGQ08_003233 [Salinibacter ruber]|nr:hypothetical protein [Salinibacter ruber]MCS3655142.1 hypothetical protein [Salinibacter ruber]